jgi:hypothetical protein
MAVLAVGVVGVVATAQATQFETINGSACENMYPPNNATLGTWLYHGQTGIWNASYQGGSPSVRYVTCPLPRISALSTAGMNPAAVVTDASASTNCWAESLDEFGNVVSSISRVGGGSSAQLISYPNISSPAWGAYVFVCAMPSQATVNALLYEEF